MKKDKYALIGAVLALVIFFISFMGPWYSINGEFLGLEASIDVGLMDTTISSNIGSSTIEAKIDREETDTTMYIVIVTIIFTIISLIGILGISFEFGKKKMMQIIGETFGFIAFLIAIIAIIYYVTNLPDISDIEFIHIEDGLGWGFFLFMLGAVDIFVTNIWLRIIRE
jgi:hypothetical protein